MKCLISLIFTFALTMAMSMSAQAEPGRQAEAKSCNVAHRAAIADCHLSREGGMRGEELSLCKAAAAEVKESCMDGSSGHSGDPGPSACETDCQSSYDSTALSCEPTIACEGALCDFLDEVKQVCLDSANTTLNSCMAGCGG